ncbi:anti-phage-associated DUF1156 domain-containing protein [Methanolobus bombayensis]|uniref:anti-phage-associated DUF1156 domain-containing protein n=1 Tax=Methanolobus bombayensis TaxID=38023 RepID=UPI001AE139F8|nr:anti-phage-associated DUF1156 domain-containing protein [Methanolobus bombayensis]MBP1909180.1 adenine-specific DNA methylase [Methanolobus bombayensis]
MSSNNIPFNKSFIESQFPVSKVSKESYKERKANYSQTLTGLGKWWGRKPLILVRAAILGLLLPATDNPTKDREIFLKILTMDDEGMWQRKKTNITGKVLKGYLSPREKNTYFDGDRLCRGLSSEEKEELQKMVFLRMGYDERLTYSYRPEEIDGPSMETWNEINDYLGTNASSIPELVEELGKRQFGKRPSVGDCFCGGGSVPFEAARIGCDVFGSDLNPVAALLTWASMNIVGGEGELIVEVNNVLQEVYDAVDKQIIEWGIEQNEKGWRADAYLYCSEVICPECGWKIPLLTKMVIGEGSKTIAKLEANEANKCYNILIHQNVSTGELESAKSAKTIDDSGVICPNLNCPAHFSPTPIEVIRQENTGGLRLWNKEDVLPAIEDVFQERLYAIRWLETFTDENGQLQSKKTYLGADNYDLQMEQKVFVLLNDRFSEWQEKGYLPSMKIEAGYNTDQPKRERGWTHWHHLFTPRQLLTNALFLKETEHKCKSKSSFVSCLLGLGRVLDRNSKLCVWDSSKANEKVANTFLNQALNTINNFGCRPLIPLQSSWFSKIKNEKIINQLNIQIKTIDARSILNDNSFWVTDPPYADAINYHELTEFFLAWYQKPLNEIFPEWYTDSKRALAIKGSDEEFRKSMVEVYKNLAEHMPKNGAQIVMFTHQDAKVWADLAMIVWAAGLQVTAAWCIATETESGGIKKGKGNYVQGTVLLVLRKQTSDDIAFLDEIYPEVEEEVKKQLSSMLDIDDKEDPNFADTDYQLAAYAAALRVLTRYKQIEDIDIERELCRVRGKGEGNPLEGVIENAVKIACDYLVPAGIDSWVWKQLMPEERFYLKGLELESHGEYRTGAYQELARGFGIREYKNLQQSKKANDTRLKTASEFKDRDVGGEGFSSSLVRNILFAIRQTRQEDDTAAGKVWLREYPGYWEKRKEIIELLRYFAALGMNDSMEQWEEDSKAAKMLSVVVEQDHI